MNLELDHVFMQQGKEHLLEIVLNEGEIGKVAEFRPEIPLIMHW